MKIDNEQYRKLLILARRTLHTAYVCNDHNFDSPESLARETAKSIDIDNFDSANDFIASLPINYKNKQPNIKDAD